MSPARRGGRKRRERAAGPGRAAPARPRRVAARPARPARDARGPLEREARASLRASQRTVALLERRLVGPLAAAAETIIACLSGGGTVFFCGNGGSAADAEHFAAELSGRFLIDRPALAALALTTNTSSLTAIGNDYGYDQVFSRPLAGLASPGDVLVAITTSGRSRNILRAVAQAQALGMIVIGMTGTKGAAFAARCDVALVTPDSHTPRVQEGHAILGHVMCELVERAMYRTSRRDT